MYRGMIAKYLLTNWTGSQEKDFAYPLKQNGNMLPEVVKRAKGINIVVATRLMPWLGMTQIAQALLIP